MQGILKHIIPGEWNKWKHIIFTFSQEQLGAWEAFKAEMEKLTGSDCRWQK